MSIMRKKWSFLRNAFKKVVQSNKFEECNNGIFKNIKQIQMKPQQQYPNY